MKFSILGVDLLGVAETVKANGKTVPFRRILVGATENYYSVIATNSISAVHLTRKCIGQEAVVAGEFCLEYTDVRDLFSTKDEVIKFRTEEGIDGLEVEVFSKGGKLVRNFRIDNHKNRFPSLGQFDKLFEEAAYGEEEAETYLNQAYVKNMMTGMGRIYKDKSVLIKLNGEKKPAYFRKVNDVSTFEGIIMPIKMRLC